MGHNSHSEDKDSWAPLLPAWVRPKSPEKLWRDYSAVSRDSVRKKDGQLPIPVPSHEKFFQGPVQSVFLMMIELTEIPWGGTGKDHLWSYRLKRQILRISMEWHLRSMWIHVACWGWGYTEEESLLVHYKVLGQDWTTVLPWKTWTRVMGGKCGQMKALHYSCCLDWEFWTLHSEDKVLDTGISPLRALQSSPGNGLVFLGDS